MLKYDYRFSLWIVLGILSAAANLSAGEYSVRDTEELAKAISRARAGDTITLEGGQWENVDILFDAEGTLEQPIALRAATPGNVIISGSSRLRIAGRHLIVDGLLFQQAHNDDHLIAFRKDSKQTASHCRLTNCAIIDCNAPNAANESRWISIFGDHNRVDHCRIEGKRTKGTTVAIFLSNEPANHRIDHNYFGPRPELNKNGGETIRIGDSKTSLHSSHVVVEHNLFEECNGESEIISNKSCDNVYRHNTFLRSAGALTLRHGHRCTVDGNFFIGEKARGTGGVRIIGEGHRVVNNYFANLEGDDQRAALSIMQGIVDSPASGYAPVKNALVAFNTFVNCKESIVIGLKDDDTEATVAPAGCTLANNLIVSNRPAIDIRSEPIDFRWRDNRVESGAKLPQIAGIQSVEKGLLRKDSHGIWRPAQNGLEGRLAKPHDDSGGDPAHHARPRLPMQPADVGPTWKVPT